VSTEASSNARRVSTEASSNATSTYASMANDTPAQNHAVPMGSVESIGKLIPDVVVVEASLGTLSEDVFDADRGSQILQEIVAVGGCFALVQLAKKFLEKARMGIPNCDQVTELTGFTMILRNSLRIVADLLFKHVVSQDIISSIGVVELVVKVMKTFPKCEDLQSTACNVLCRFTTNFVVMTKISEAGAFEPYFGCLLGHLTPNPFGSDRLGALQRQAQGPVPVQLTKSTDGPTHTKQKK
jgi:hypothetical protein